SLFPLVSVHHVPPPPPTSPLFPYTTLFRSKSSAFFPIYNIFTKLPAPKAQRGGGPDTGPPPLLILNSYAVGALNSWASWRTISLDRKSTRLNSSHVSISYAVFCLKKKK